MSRKATEFQKKEMSRMYRGKEIFKPLNTGWIDGHVACVREWVANIFFYRKGDTTIMIDAGYNYHYPSGYGSCGRGGSGQSRAFQKRKAVRRRNRKPLPDGGGSPQGDLSSL